GPDPGAYLKPEIAAPDRSVEYTPPLDDDLRDFARTEFEANEVFEERWAAGAAKRAAEGKRRRKLKKMLLAVAGVAVVGAMTLGAGAIAPDPVPGPGGNDPIPGPGPEPTPTPPQVDCPTPSTIVGEAGSIISYSFSRAPIERGTGDVVLVAVYNDEWFANGDFWGNRLIGEYKCPEEEFEAWTLPAAETPLGEYGDQWTFEPIGYVMYYGPLEMTEDTYGTHYWVEGESEFALMLEGNQITWDEVQFIPPDEHGIRFVEIHVVYALTTSPDADLVILADDGLGNVTAYPTASSPLQSAGVTWLGVLPIPEMDCYYFAGWFDKEGRQVWYAWNEDIYEYSYTWIDGQEWPETEIIIHPFEIVAGWVPAE
ncbi:MAG: hypothetical protein IKD70_08110, partial [Eggerthellaceae bacterium]|nr:hypothetical protein [Eggerthellaceae bacterium]